jgi:hypothetical protein
MVKRTIAFENILFDVVIATAAVFASRAVPFVADHLMTLYCFAWIPHFAALYMAITGGLVANEQSFNTGNKRWDEISAQAFVITTFFLLPVGFMWSIMPGIAMGVSSVAIAVYNVAVVAFFIVMIRKLSDRPGYLGAGVSSRRRILSSGVVFAYLLFVDLMIAAAAMKKPSHVFRFAGVLTFFYLPYRLYLGLTPPSSRWEVLSAVLAYAAFMVSVVQSAGI